MSAPLTLFASLGCKSTGGASLLNARFQGHPGAFLLPLKKILSHAAGLSRHDWDRTILGPAPQAFRRDIFKEIFLQTGGLACPSQSTFPHLVTSPSLAVD